MENNGQELCDQKTGKRRIWKEYQKEIPDDRYFYVRSCIRQTFFPASEQMFLKILRDDLGKDIYENPHHTTCSGIGYHGDVIPLETSMTIVARQFALMAEAGYENLAVSCITSFGLYSEFLETWKHFPQVRERIADHLRKATGRELVLPKCVAHASDIVYRLKDEIAARRNTAWWTRIPASRFVWWSTSDAIMPRCSLRKGSEGRSILACFRAWPRRGAGRSSITPSVGIAAVSVSGSTWCGPTGGIACRIQKRNSTRWSRIIPM